MHTLHTLYKALKFTLKTLLKLAPEDGLKNGTETCRGKFLVFFHVNFSAF